MGVGGEEGPPPELPESAVAAEEYDRDYYLHTCWGADPWRESEGREVAGIYVGILREHLRLRPGVRLLDVGTGRGELVRVAMELGASEAVGIDYSADAIALARSTLEASDTKGAEVVQADSRDMPFEDERFDLVTMIEVVEHLAADELEATLAEAHRVLRPSGELFVHTAPNRLVYDVTYRLQRGLRPSRRRAWPREPRTEAELRMHVNEQRIGSLRRTLRRAGFRVPRAWHGSWVHATFAPDPRAQRTYYRLARIPGLRRLGVFDLYARAVKT